MYLCRTSALGASRRSYRSHRSLGGRLLPGWHFRGEKIEFDGREGRVYDGGLYMDTGDPGDVVGFILRLYECLSWTTLPHRRNWGNDVGSSSSRRP
jgi:hypothetical protein